MRKAKSQSGFTVIEIIVVSIIFIAAAVLFYIQFNNLQAKTRDDNRKTAINSMYYSLEEVFYKNNSYYPTSLNKDILPSVPESLLKDREGILVGDKNSEYRYEATNCADNKCKSYTLRTSLEKEGDFVKKSRNK